MEEETLTEKEPQNEEIKDPAAVLAELRRAQQDLKDLRAENRNLKNQVEASDPTEWKKRAVAAEAKLSLANQGIKDADRIMKYLDLDGVDFDDNGDLTGLEDKLTQVKTDLPELFDVKRRVGGKADIFADGETHHTPSASEVQAQQLLA